MLSRINNKHNYKTFSESPPASLLHCIGHILSHSSRRWRDSLTMAALSFTKGCSEFHHCTTFIRLVFHLVQASGTVKGFSTNKNKCVSFKFTKFLPSNEL